MSVCVCVCVRVRVCVCLDLFNQKGGRKSSKVYIRRRHWQPTPVLLPGESQGREPGGLPSMGLHRVGHE